MPVPKNQTPARNDLRRPREFERRPTTRRRQIHRPADSRTTDGAAQLVPSSTPPRRARGPNSAYKRRASRPQRSFRFRRVVTSTRKVGRLQLGALAPGRLNAYDEAGTLPPQPPPPPPPRRLRPSAPRASPESSSSVCRIIFAEIGRGGRIHCGRRRRGSSSDRLSRIIRRRIVLAGPLGAFLMDGQAAVGRARCDGAAGSSIADDSPKNRAEARDPRRLRRRHGTDGAAAVEQQASAPGRRERGRRRRLRALQRRPTPAALREEAAASRAFFVGTAAEEPRPRRPARPARPRATDGLGARRRRGAAGRAGARGTGSHAEPQEGAERRPAERGGARPPRRRPICAAVCAWRGPTHPAVNAASRSGRRVARTVRSSRRRDARPPGPSRTTRGSA